MSFNLQISCANKSLHWIFTPLRSVKTSEFRRSVLIAMYICRNCDHEVSKWAGLCPNCGEPDPAIYDPDIDMHAKGDPAANFIIDDLAPVLGGICGLLFGIIGGFYFAGIGGAILFGFLGAIGGGIVAPLVMVLLGTAIWLLICIGVFSIAIWLLSLLWGLGKP